MPVGTKVHSLAEALQKKGYSVGSSIAISQSKTHQSYATGKKLPPKGKAKRKRAKG